MVKAMNIKVEAMKSQVAGMASHNGLILVGLLFKAAACWSSLSSLSDLKNIFLQKKKTQQKNSPKNITIP
jgi:hypothetical protein